VVGQTCKNGFSPRLWRGDEALLSAHDPIVYVELRYKVYDAFIEMKEVAIKLQKFKVVML